MINILKYNKTQRSYYESIIYESIVITFITPIRRILFVGVLIDNTIYYIGLISI